jgi:16S rRNA (guanine527-N7)-methyltransferase
MARKTISATGAASPAERSSPVAFPFPADGLLEKGLVSLGFSGSADPSICGASAVRGIDEIIPLANRYIKELELFNAVFDLVGVESRGSGGSSAQGRSDLVVRHILDSLAPWKTIAGILSPEIQAFQNREESPFPPEVADAGSGAGFPGIPLAIAFPNLHFTLIERMSRRCSFLENCAAMLGLKNVTVLNSEVEKAPKAAFDLVVFRAFRPLDAPMIRTLLGLTKDDGLLAAYKARKEKIHAEMSAIEAEIDGWEIVPLTVPFLEHEERHLMLTTSARNPNRPYAGSC